METDAHAFSDKAVPLALNLKAASLFLPLLPFSSLIFMLLLPGDTPATQENFVSGICQG